MKNSALLLFAALPLVAEGQASLEGTIWNLRRNEIRKPAGSGTTLDLTELLGPGRSTAARLDLRWRVGDRQHLRVLLAPFEVTGSARLGAEVRFQDTTFAAGLPTEARYRFNSWRASWSYQLVQDQGWTVRLGATAKVRDAKVELRQAGRAARTTDLGFVPLAHVAAERRLGDSATLVFELDGLAAPQGRAVDAALLLRWRAFGRVHLDAGYRLLEGGADNDQLYTWARLDGWRIGASVAF